MPEDKIERKKGKKERRIATVIEYARKAWGSEPGSNRCTKKSGSVKRGKGFPAPPREKKTSSRRAKKANLLERTRFLTWDHSWYMLNVPLGSILLRVADTRLRIGSDRKRRRAKDTASAVLARRRSREFVSKPAAANPGMSALFPDTKGVVLGLTSCPMVRSSQKGAVSRATPPLVTKTRSSKSAFFVAGGCGGGSGIACSMTIVRDPYRGKRKGRRESSRNKSIQAFTSLS